MLFAQTEQVTDIDGNVYSTVKIGAQTWMTENLRVTHYPDGNAIPATYYYNNDLSKLDAYGRLYPWNEAMNYSTKPGAQGVCPDGYHIPSDEDWQALERFLGVPENELNMHSGNRGAGLGYKLLPGNNTGFNGVTGGFWYDPGQSFWYEGTGYYWSSSQRDAETAIYRTLGSYYLPRWEDGSKYDAMSVRCMKDQDYIFVTFKVDMNNAIAAGNFTEGNDKVYISGSMVDWSEPGNELLELKESAVDNIYTVEVYSLPGQHNYRYYLNTGWDQPEWPDDVNRSAFIDENTTIIEDIFGPEPAKPISEFKVNVTELPSTLKADDRASHLSVSREQSFPPIIFDYEYSLISGEGSADNDLFYIHGDSLMTKYDLAATGKSEFQVRLKVEDQFDISAENSFVFSVKHSNWEKYNSGLNDYTRQITATSEDNVWAVANTGEIAKTNDGGKNWEVISTFSGTTPGGLCVIDENTAWIVIYNYSENPNSTGLYKTTDGGTNWTRQSGLYDGEGAFPNWVRFWNENDGLVAGDSYELYTTSNGGASWTPVSDMPDLTDYQFNNPSNTAIVGDTIWYSTQGAIYRSPDKGNTWQAFPIEYQGTELVFKNHLEGLLIQSASSTKMLYNTVDGGETWTPVNPEGPFREYGLLYDENNEHYISCGRYTDSLDYYGVSYSSDNGQTWTSDDSFVYPSTLISLNGSLPGIIWATGFHGDVYKTLSGSINNLAPVLNGSIPDTVARVDEPFEYTIPGGLFSDPDEEDALSFSAKQTNGEALPEWLTMTSQTLSGIPAEMDLLNLRITAQDKYGLSVSDDFKLVVEEYKAVSIDEIEIENTSSEGVVIVFIPASVFTDMGLTGEIVYEAYMADGSPLPDYIEFDADSLLFRFTVSEKKSLMDILEEISLIIKGTDSSGYVGIIGFTIEGDLVGLSNEITSMLKIYPQPAIDILNIEFYRDFPNTRKITVYSVKGQMLRSIESSEKRIELDLGSLPSSVYYLRIIDEKDRTYQIIKQ